MRAAGDERYDVAVVGSGYGGAVVAQRLAADGQRVCVLERGRAYPPGYFPRGAGGLTSFLWRATRGLFDVSVLDGQLVVTAAGLGGGSLIDAGMLVRPDVTVLSELAWPLDPEELEPHFRAVEAALAPAPFPRNAAAYASMHKARPLLASAEADDRAVERPPLAIAFDAGDGSPPAPGRLVREQTRNLHGRERYTCRLVGECVMGCNYGAKSSLDLTLLSRAFAAGAEIRAGCEVDRLEAVPEGYRIFYRGTEGTGTTADLHAARVVLAAGALGTPQLLLRNQPTLPNLSSALGTEAATAGVRLTGIRGTDVDAAHGPTVTAALRLGGGVTVTDAGYPQILHWLLQAAVASTENAPRSLAAALGLPSAELELSREPASPQDLLPLAVLGGGRAGGKLRLTPAGELAIEWPAAVSNGDGAPARDPIQRLGYAEDRGMAELGRLLVLQPLGGCPMSPEPGAGVVDPWGEVWGHPGLFVADGSLLPGPVEPAPALTIAALADRIASRLLTGTNLVRNYS